MNLIKLIEKEAKALGRSPFAGGGKLTGVERENIKGEVAKILSEQEEKVIENRIPAPQRIDWNKIYGDIQIQEIVVDNGIITKIFLWKNRTCYDIGIKPYILRSSKEGGKYVHCTEEGNKLLIPNYHIRSNLIFRSILIACRATILDYHENNP